MEASELFQICAELAMTDPSGPAIRQMHELLVLASAEGCRQQGGTFGNLFSQIDWVCKQLHISRAETQAIQTARRHSNQSEPIAADDWLYDLRAVARYISRVFVVDVPGSLLCLLPANGKPQSEHLKVNKLYIRCIVRSFDDYVIVADADEGELHIDYGNTEDGRDFGYLKKVLREGMQLNLLDCHVDAQVITPQVIVVEPDFLLDISSLAACFTAYGHHPLLYTVNRLKPQSNTQATLLGNFAGTALDDVIHHPDVTLQQSLQRSYREQADRIRACEDFDQEKFEQAAAQQMQNIREAVSLLSPNQALLEPSFICERLGLQGRVDLMTADMQLLVEQKSGKNMKIEYQSHDAHGMQLENHYVQLLLYYGILRYNFGKSDRQVDTRLLYSRYPAAKGLVVVNYYRTLFREAIRLRNQIVATELLIARDGFGRILPLLNADIIYKGVPQDGFFHRFVAPSLQTLNSQLSSLSALERAYFERMMTFVYREQQCQKLGVVEGQGGATSDLWQMPLSEKRETGNIYTDLTVIDRQRSCDDGGFDVITLQLSGEAIHAPINFRLGDMVYLYQYKAEPDVRESILYKGVLQDIKNGVLVVLLNDGQQNPDVFPVSSTHWAIEHGGSDVGTNSQIRGLYQFVTAPVHRRQLLLGQREPREDASLLLSKSYHPHYDDILLRAKQARDYFLLVGPPGTGKTSMALRFMVEEELSSTSSSSILLMAYTNRAVDEIRAMLQDAGLADEERIVTGTTSMMQARPFLMAGRHFSLAIIDEASQILEPSIIGLLSNVDIDRFVMIGDHKQLPAVVQQTAEQAAVDSEELRSIGISDCRQSLFERLYRWECSQGRTQFIGTLNHQGRMHPEVAQFPSAMFYTREQLQPVPLKHQLEGSLEYDLPAEDTLDELLKERRMLFLPVVPQHPFSSPKSNTDEAQLVVDLLHRIRRFYGNRFDARKTVGIIVPYRNQIAAIRQAIGDDEAFADVTIDTVERYQGSQREVIIYSFTVSRRYQLDFLTNNSYTDVDGSLVDRKLNVALTRARRQMLMVGNPNILQANPLFAQLIARFS
ncbi:MAG: ATP-binding protein [Prevotella sp.]|nr:ATP-binding protein [Prevotella sp.]